MLWEFVFRFQKKRIQLSMMPNDCTIEALTEGLDLKSSIPFFILEERLTKFEETTRADVHNRYKLNIRIEDEYK